MIRVVCCIIAVGAALVSCEGCRRIKAPYSPKEPPTPKIEVVDAASTQPATRPTSGRTYVEYTVKRGDDFSKIAKKLYNNAANWKFIQDDNPDVDQRKLREGMVLKVRVFKKKPPASAPTTTSTTRRR